MRVFLLAIVMALLLGLLAAPAFAANPHDSSPGQPGKECGEKGATASPQGFDTSGFANAETKYAGSQPRNSNNPKSVSQYDVACFQVT
jgi:hypothetical protein